MNHSISGPLENQTKIEHFKQDTVVLWSKSSTLDQKVEGSNPAAANFSFETDKLDTGRKKRRRKRKQARPRTNIDARARLK